MIAGGSRIAYYLAKSLEESGIRTTIIEKDEETCTMLAGLLPKATIIHGDASDHSVLDSEDLEDYDAFVSLTGIDEINITVTIIIPAIFNISIITTQTNT